jgi:peptidoglycan hydrolase CwlO-like protein
MSTAGKVLVVLVMLASIGCLMLAGGVAQLNTNANKRLQELSTQLAKAQEDIVAARHEAMVLRDETSETQERIDREVATLRARQTDLERSKTQITNDLARLQYDLSTVNATIQGARTSIQTRTAEFDADEKEIADLRGRVQSLKSNNAESMARLQSLRQEFRDTYHKNVDMVGKPR